MSDLSGQSIGRYHIVEPLGEGGMATVYKAYDTRLERDVAIKVIRTGAFPGDQLDRILKRFEREAKSLARLSHPNIVGVIDYGDYEGAPYLVMEYLPGGTLKQKLGKPVPWREAVQNILPVARALKFAHDQGIVHRDVKPANVLTTLSGEPMLTDFGIAKLLEETEGQTLTGTGVGIGTPEYMAPEQWTGQAGKQADIYSLGIVLYELVTGRKPYIADTPAAVLLKQANEPLPRPSKFIPTLPAAVEQVLFKALAKKPEDRYTGMGEFIAGLESLLAGSAQAPQSLPMGEADLTRDELTPAESPVPQPARRETAPALIEPARGKPGGRKRWLVPALILGPILLCLLACVLMWTLSICPPQGPWPQPPWCPGSTLRWPFNEPIPLYTQTPEANASGSIPLSISTLEANASGSIPMETATPFPGVYVVQMGDTCNAIAVKYQVSVQDIVQANGLDSNCNLNVGQSLLIPLPGSAQSAPGQTCTIPGFEGQPTFATTFPNGLSDLDALGIRHQSLNGGQIYELRPGLSFSSDQRGAAYIEFPASGGGQQFALHLVSGQIYQVGILEDVSTNTWADAAYPLFALGLHVDHFGPAGENAGIFYNDGTTGWILVKPQFTPPAGQDIFVLFNLAAHQFRVSDSSGNKIYEVALPTKWGDPNNPDKWWFIGDHWTDNIYSTSFKLMEICFKQ